MAAEPIDKPLPDPRDARGDTPLTVTVTRDDGKWNATADGYEPVSARNLMELVGVMHSAVLVKDNQPRALTFIYPYADEVAEVKHREEAVSMADAALSKARDDLVKRLAADGVTRADMDRLLA